MAKLGQRTLINLMHKQALSSFKGVRVASGEGTLWCGVCSIGKNSILYDSDIRVAPTDEVVPSLMSAFRQGTATKLYNDYAAPAGDRMLDKCEALVEERFDSMSAVTQLTLWSPSSARLVLPPRTPGVPRAAETMFMGHPALVCPLRGQRHIQFPLMSHLRIESTKVAGSHFVLKLASLAEESPVITFSDEMVLGKFTPIADTTSTSEDGFDHTTGEFKELELPVQAPLGLHMSLTNEFEVGHPLIHRVQAGAEPAHRTKWADVVVEDKFWESMLSKAKTAIWEVHSPLPEDYEPDSGIEFSLDNSWLLGLRCAESEDY